MTTPQLLMASVIASSLLITGCQDKSEPEASSAAASSVAAAEPAITEADPALFINQPLVRDIYTSNPSAHVFNGKIYTYVSQDADSGAASEGDKFSISDYRVLSMSDDNSSATLHDAILSLKDIPWASSDMGAPSAAEKDGKYYLFFPAKNKEQIFQLGVATSDSPTGPFKAEPEPIKDSFSTDPTVFKDEDGAYYMYFGGIEKGQLQRWASGSYVAEDKYPPTNEPSYSPKIARMSDDLLQFAESPKDVQILDSGGVPILSKDINREFFDGAWVHKFNGKYYLSYFIKTNFIAYAISDTPYGPFTHKGMVLTPVLGATSHHSIVNDDGKWYLFYHDAQLSGGKDHLRNVKVTELIHQDDGTINIVNTYLN